MHNLFTKNNFFWIVLVTAVVVFLRIYGLSQGDTVNDEAAIAFRAIGMVDYLKSDEQTTPDEWADPVPFESCATDKPEAICETKALIRHNAVKNAWWLPLSFHDHPPLVFWIQHFFMRILGERPWAFRLPSAIFGLGSILVLYGIGKILFGRRTGLLAAAILGLTLNHVYISRVGLQESYVIFFVLLTIYCFLKAREKDFYYLISGVALGLGLLAKYTSFIVAPILIIYALCFERRIFRNWKLWAGGGVALLLFSPIILYNIGLYRAVGHFDFQFSYIFGQHPEIWQSYPGKDIGTLNQRLSDFLPRLLSSNSWSLLSFFALAVFAAARNFLKKPADVWRSYGFLIISLVALCGLILLVGPSFRFLTMLTPFLALGAGVLADSLIRHRGKIAVFGVALGLGFELFYSINNQLLPRAIGSEIFLASPVRAENYRWGYAKLDDFFSAEFKGRVPAWSFTKNYGFLRKLQVESLEAARKGGATPYPILVIYDESLFDLARLWVLDRHFFYEGWPIISTADYDELLKKQGENYFKKLGFKKIYGVFSGTQVLLNADGQNTEATLRLKRDFAAGGAALKIIAAPSGATAFEIYNDEF